MYLVTFHHWVLQFCVLFLGSSVPEHVQVFINAHILYLQSTQSNKLSIQLYCIVMIDIVIIAIQSEKLDNCDPILPPLRNRAVQAWLALVNSTLSGCNHQSLAVTTPERNLSAKDPVPRQLVVVNSYQGIKKPAREGESLKENIYYFHFNCFRD